MSSIFNFIKVNKPKRSKFDLSHEVKMSMKMGTLTPFICREVLPGDKFRVNTEVMMRLAPMVAPVMHRVNVYTHFFFVPNRLIWDDWEEFITGGKDGNSEPVMPYLSSMAAQYFSKGSLADYMGIPVVDVNNYPDNLHINALPFRAYQLIYNEYYRDQNLHDEIEFSRGSGEISRIELAQLLKLRNRCWEKDYFTSALPWTQKGGDVHLPMTGDAPVVMDSTGNYAIVDSATPQDGGTALKAGISGNSNRQPLYAGGSAARIDPNGTLKADMSGVTSATINELRNAVSLQKWLEAGARGGSRYVERLLVHFGVLSDDARLQRPEFLGGGKTPISISEVLQTSSTDATSPQANMSGHGIAVGNSHRFDRYFKEHGYIIGIMSVLPRTAYQQGVPRQYLKYDKFDFAFPEFAHLGEQPVYKSELFLDRDTSPTDVFGYQSRYCEYKYIPSTVHGDFIDDLNYWHMGRLFSNKPELNAQFVTADPTKRIFAVTDETVDTLYVHLYNNFKASRLLPKFGTPRL